jgi:hypothetical protein
MPPEIVAARKGSTHRRLFRQSKTDAEVRAERKQRGKLVLLVTEDATRSRTTGKTSSCMRLIQLEDAPRDVIAPARARELEAARKSANRKNLFNRAKGPRIAAPTV